MSSTIERHSTTESVALNTAVGTTGEINYINYCGGTIHVPSSSSITSLTWHSSNEPGGTFVASYDKDGAAVTQTVAAGRSYPIPDALFGSRAIKAVADAAESVLVSLKG